MTKTRSQKSQNVPIKFVIRDIALTDSNFLVEKDYIIVDKKNLKYSIMINYSFEASTGHLDIIFNYTFYENDKPLHIFETNNLFTILKSFVKNMADENIKQSFLLNMTELALNHSRGIHTYILKDTFMEKLYIPIIEEKQLGKIIETEIVDL